jgi:UDP-N-acetylglucosamine 4,6-dehydratase/5-epimerase
MGGEVFVPRIPSMSLVDLARAIEPKCSFKIIGIRPGEKVHETLVSEDEARKTKVFDGRYVILPQFFENKEIHKKYEKYPLVPEGFVYRSDQNDAWLTVKELQKMIQI